MFSKDERPILAIFIGDDIQRLYKVGRHGVTKITTVEENAEYCYVPWFEVWKGEEVCARVNAGYVGEVIYQTESER